MLHFLIRILRLPAELKWSNTLLALVAMLTYSIVGFMLTEGRVRPELDWSDAFWWSIVSMTTVGYGDLFPTTTAGRFLVGMPTIFFGCAIVAQLLGTMADRIIKSESNQRKGLKKLRHKNHIIIIRMPSLTKVHQLVDEIRADSTTRRSPIVLIDETLDEIPEDLTAKGVQFISGQADELSVLQRASFRTAKTIIILAHGEDRSRSDLLNLSIVLTIESEAPDIATIAEVLNPEKVAAFKRAGCDSVICLSDISAQLIAQEMQDPGLGQIVKELTTNRNGQQLYIIPIPSQITSYSDLQKAFEPGPALLIGVKHGHQEKNRSSWNPESTFLLSAGDHAIIISPERPNPI